MFAVFDRERWPGGRYRRRRWFVHQEGQKLAKLVEAQEASRPIPLISFVAKQRDLRDLVAEDVTGSEKLGFEETLHHSGGRFHHIELEDTNLPEIVSQRILKLLNAAAAEQIDEAFNSTAKMREEVLYRRNREGRKSIRLEG